MKLKGIDLFCGVGGFHIAANLNGIDIVFASEIDVRTSFTYEENFGLKPEGDITKVNTEDIPSHNILLGGFPCQPFSKAGLRKGFEDTRGTLFFDIARILEFHKPKYLLLENVLSLAKHDNGNTWNTIKKTLRDLGYMIPDDPVIISPQSFGTPQIRKRVFIPGVLKSKISNEEFDFKIPKPKNTSIEDIRIKKYDNDKTLLLSDYQIKVLKCWSEFKNHFDYQEIQHPIWSYDFFKDTSDSDDPVWKQNWSQRNRDLYLSDKKWIDNWYKKWDVTTFRRQDQKFEWNCKDKINSLEEGIIQFRSSGVRVKTPDIAPTLVAKNDRIVMPGAKRFISIEETARLQDFPKEFKWSNSDSLSLKQLGNAVNVKVTKYMIEELIKY